jgi:hypothetical protein
MPKDSWINRLLCLPAESPWKACKVLEIHICIAVVMGSTPIGIASPTYTWLCHQHMLAFIAVLIDIARIETSEDGHICSQLQFALLCTGCARRPKEKRSSQCV